MMPSTSISVTLRLCLCFLQAVLLQNLPLQYFKYGYQMPLGIINLLNILLDNAPV